MLRRWGILLGMLTLLAGVAVATTGSASAGTMGFRPGGPIQLVGSASAVPNARGGIRHQAESTNWSGYAGTTGTYTDRKSTRLNSSHYQPSRMPSSA